MTSKELSNGILRTIIIILIALAGIYFLSQISVVILYIFLSLLLTLISLPIVKLFKEKLKFKNTLAVVTTLLLQLIIISGLFLLFVPLIVNQGQKLALLNVKSIESNYLIYFKNIQNYLSEYNIDINEFINSLKQSKSFNFNFIPKLLNDILSSIGNFGMGLFSVFFITFFILKDNIQANKNLKFALPSKNRWRILASILRIRRMLSNYTIGLLIQLAVVFVLYLIVLLIFGVENALIIAFLSAILNIIPYVGPIIALGVTTFLIMISHLDQSFSEVTMPVIIKVVIGYFIVQFIDNNVSQPIIASKSTDSHPLEIFIVVLIAGFSMGIVGMIIAIPLYTTLKIIASEFFPNNKLVHILSRR